MESFLELIITIIFSPFESKIDDLLSGINRIKSKPLRILIKISIPLTLWLVLFGICCLLNYLIRGYWI
jgi:hypothetical protein